MAKTKPQSAGTRASARKSKANRGSTKRAVQPDVLLAQATALLQTGEAERALSLAQRALAILQPGPDPTLVSLPALSLLGEINIELGDQEAAYTAFELAARADPDGNAPEERGGGPEKFFWLAQLCEEGGADSVRWYEKGAECLRRQIVDLEARPIRPADRESRDAEVAERREKLAQALCGIAEVYMTDLSWDDNEAEEHCNKVMVEALLVAPDSVDVLQTIASVRISQSKAEEARRYLLRSMALWQDLAPDDLRIPEFPTRISLARLLIESQMEEKALEVLERLVQEDDSSVEAGYLGGWCLNLLGHKTAATTNNGAKANEPDMAQQQYFERSRTWLLEVLRLCRLQEYEDDRLMAHAQEIIQELNERLDPLPEGELPTGFDVNNGEEDWEDDHDDEGDEDMEDG